MYETLILAIGPMVMARVFLYIKTITYPQAPETVVNGSEASLHVQGDEYKLRPARNDYHVHCELRNS